MKNNYYIYFHINLVSNEVFYVGKGKGRRAWSKGNRNPHWKNIVSKYGYRVYIVKDGLTDEEAKIREIYYIKEIGRKDLGLGSLVNFTNGGDGGNGVIRSEEQKQKMSEHRKGKTFSDEHRKNISISKKGIKGNFKSDEQKAKISERQLGRVISNKTKEKISNTLKGNIPWNKGKVGGQKHSEETKAKMRESHKLRLVK